MTLPRYDKQRRFDQFTDLAGSANHRWVARNRAEGKCGRCSRYAGSHYRCPRCRRRARLKAREKRLEHPDRAVKRKDTRRERYIRLRALGVGSTDARVASGSLRQFQQLVRRLENPARDIPGTEVVPSPPAA